MNVAFVGAGQMGLPMVQRLAGAGHAVTVYARRAEARAACVEAGAAATGSLADALPGAEAIVVCLYADAQVRELASGPGGFVAEAEPGALVVLHTTGSPATARDLAREGAARGVRVVDAPVSGSADDIRDGHVTVLLGGEPGDVERARSVVAAYGDPVLALGPLGSAQLVKLMNNALFAAQLQLAGEIERVAGDLGVDIGQAASAIQRSSGASYAMGLVASIGSAATIAELGGHFLRKDVATARAVAGELGIDLGVVGHVHEHGRLVLGGRPAG
jgi:3-hydroxyisobutyrate dehydrogenase-like beta-hydroxyacid dehydrogenase